MANEMNVQFEGTIGGDIGVRNAGEKRVLNIRLATKARRKRGQEFVDTETIWLDGSLWERWSGDARIDNVLGSLQKGDRVQVSGRMYAEAYPTNQGGEAVANRLEIESITPSLSYATAAPVKNQRNDQQNGWGQQGQPGGQPTGQPAWGQPAAPAQQGWGQPAAPAAAPNWATQQPAPVAAPAPAPAPAPAAPAPAPAAGGWPQPAGQQMPGAMPSGFDDEQPF